MEWETVELREPIYLRAVVTGQPIYKHTYTQALSLLSALSVCFDTERSSLPDGGVQSVTEGRNTVESAQSAWCSSAACLNSLCDLRHQE